jgi:hypothetical protein
MRERTIHNIAHTRMNTDNIMILLFIGFYKNIVVYILSRQHIARR